MMNTNCKRPRLMMPDSEAFALVEHYNHAGVILEYGSGGSTVLASEMASKPIFSVESDKEWLDMMKVWFVENPPISMPILHHGDIGPTKAWGHPVDEKAYRRWPGYPNSVWQRADFQHPDVVLIDGRFRVACWLTVLFQITRPITVLFDDYLDRPYYHRVEDLVKPAEMIGRMARFELTPTTVPADRLGWIIDAYLRPN